MKRLGNIWKDVISVENGIYAIVEGTRYKRGDRAVKKLLYDDETVQKDPCKWHRIDNEKAKIYAEKLIPQLENKTWEHSPPRYKIQYCKNRASSKGKWRDLYIPTLDDHIIAHMLMNASMKAFTRGMHPHCCGSVPNRGINHLVKKVSGWMQDDKECRYFVKLDIRKFFDNIDKDILLRKLSEKIKDKDVLWAFEKIINSAPVPCPVGYYTSPWFANLYLEDLDWFVTQELYKSRRGKRTNYVRHYLRYVDDILLIGTSKSDLEKAVKSIKKYLHDNLGLEIKDQWEIKAIGKHEIVDGKWKLKPNTYWCDIGGYKFCKDSTILRDGIFLASRRLSRKMYKQGRYTLRQCQSLNSSIGWAGHCDSYNFIENEIKPFVNMKATRRMISDVDKKRKRGKHHSYKI